MANCPLEFWSRCAGCAAETKLRLKSALARAILESGAVLIVPPWETPAGEATTPARIVRRRLGERRFQMTTAQTTAMRIVQNVGTSFLSLKPWYSQLCFLCRIFSDLTDKLNRKPNQLLNQQHFWPHSRPSVD
jgi:hypothetical protein